jgi:protein-tyrosine phosphatase
MMTAQPPSTPIATRHPLFGHILIVCAGNICRSPVAEALLRVQLAAAGRDTELKSAGLVAELGRPADAMTAAVARRHGLDLSAHRSRPLEPEMIRAADLVLTMEQGQRGQMLALAPLAAGKLYLLGHWTGGEIPDPYLGDWADYERAYLQIAEAVAAWLPRLK